jgi:hypothetical protein
VAVCLAPGNAPAGLLLVSAGVLLETLGITFKHEEPGSQG